MIIWSTIWVCNLVLLLFLFWHFKNKIAPLNRMPEIYELELNPPTKEHDEGQESIYQMNWKKHSFIHKLLFVFEYVLFICMITQSFIVLSKHLYL